MSHFYSCIQGSCNPATRTGDKSSGITASTFGWDINDTVTTAYFKELSIEIVHLHTTRNNDRTKSLVIFFAVVDGTLKRTQSNYSELFI